MTFSTVTDREVLRCDAVEGPAAKHRRSGEWQVASGGWVSMGVRESL
ncbi:MAG: hypothetical protein HN919_12145 [Verrucomicrobia bacterium]|nr:hypothetical protein [Verrucomicrobiota bacterium]MBT7701705.1 hypothetical protein [Verrucomicrobiota bacterium]